MKHSFIILLIVIAAGLLARPAPLFAAEGAPSPSSTAPSSPASTSSPSVRQASASDESAVLSLKSDKALSAVASRFSWLDWSVIAAYLIFTTVLGAILAGRQATIRDFFLGGRKLPWIAVYGSIIATEFSAASFLVVPAVVFGQGGNLTYLQLAIGTIVARFIIGIFFVPAFYEREIYSPYDYMGNRLGERVRKITTLLFVIGAVLAQGARIFIAALAVQVTTGTSLYFSIILMMAFSVLWTWIGGIRTVIWTDFIQFILFTVGALVALFYIGFSIEGGFPQVFREALAAGKLRLLDTTFDTTSDFTLWCGLLATVWLTLASHGTDQLNAQRLFTCRNVSDARKAIIWSSTSQLITLTLLFIGAGLFVYYQHHPLDANAQVIVGKNVNQVFAVFIVDVLPRGVSGLVMAAIFAAAISTIESALAALAQVTQANLPASLRARVNSPAREVVVSRLLVVAWGVGLAAFAMFCNTIQGNYNNLLSFALAMTAYTYGGLLGTFLLALLPTNRNDLGLVWGVPLAMLTVFGLTWHTGWAPIAVAFLAGILLGTALAVLWGRPLRIAVIACFVGALLFVVLWLGRNVPANKPILVWPWHYPIGTAITFLVGYLVGERRPPAG